MIVLRANLLKQAALEAIIKNLEKENALISSAWYDLTSRLQSNHVVLQRRHDVPKSWLNKQRQLVNGMHPINSCRSQSSKTNLTHLVRSNTT
jgi:hypothetical protein